MIGFKIPGWLALAIMLSVVGACTNNDKGPIPADKLPEEKNPPNVAMDERSTRTLVRVVTLDGDFVSALDAKGYYGSIDVDSACAHWVKIEKAGAAIEVIELVNDAGCYTATEAAPEEKVRKRLNFVEERGIYNIFNENQAKPIGRMHKLVTTQYGESKITGALLKDLCTNAYDYENDGGVCIMTISEKSGDWEDLYEF